MTLKAETLRALVYEYRPTMPVDVLHLWAVDVRAALLALLEADKDERGTNPETAGMEPVDCPHEAWEQRHGHRTCADCKAFLDDVEPFAAIRSGSE